MRITAPAVALFALAAGAVAEEQGAPRVYEKPSISSHHFTWTTPTPGTSTKSFPSSPVVTTPFPRSSSIIPPPRNITTPRGSSTPVTTPASTTSGGGGGSTGTAGNTGGSTGGSTGSSPTSTPPVNPAARVEVSEITYIGAALGALGAFMALA